MLEVLEVFAVLEGAGGDALCSALYVGSCGGRPPFARGVGCAGGAGGDALRSALYAVGTGGDALCAALYAGGCGGWTLFARRVGDV